MGQNMFATFLVVTLCMTACLAVPPPQSKPARSDSSTPINQIPIQAEPKQPGEEELSNVDAIDQEFDNSILSTSNRPTSGPAKARTASLYSQQKSRVASEATATRGAAAPSINFATELIDINPYYKYYTRSDWFVNSFRCCPRYQNYGCRSYRKPMPCFTHFINGRLDWCCPVWPSFPRLYIANSNCSKCLIMSSNCFTEGRCRRRYTRKTFLAVCYRDNWWGYLTLVTRYLPTSSYCKANRFNILPIGRDARTAA